jgi:hypothetical protein
MSIITCCALSLAVSLAGAVCPVVVTPCSTSWTCSQNQTFAYLGVAQPNFVQIYSYWGASSGCLDGGSAVRNASSLPLSRTMCTSKGSVWSYGPGSIKEYVFYNSTVQGLCLALVAANQSEATKGEAIKPLSFSLTLRQCCSGRKVPCTAVENDAQLWLEPPTTTDPYSIIKSKYTMKDVSFCLTRVGTHC